VFEVVQNEGNECCRGFNHRVEQGRSEDESEERITMTTSPQTITPAEALALNTIVTPTEQGIASRVLARTAGGNLTMVVPLEAIRNITCQADVLASRILVAADNVDDHLGMPSMPETS
jgi:hypothetical protein